MRSVLPYPTHATYPTHLRPDHQTCVFENCRPSTSTNDPENVITRVSCHEACTITE